jgi:hypothetical protein
MDELYDAPKDVNFPERAYIAPPDIAITDTDNDGGKFIWSFIWDVTLVS